MKSDHQIRIEKFMHLAGQEVPEYPTLPSFDVRRLRARLILEEALEAIEALGFKPTYVGFDPAVLDNRELFELVPPNLVEVVDGCADLSVVSIGTLSAFGVDDLPILREVDTNNLEKFGPGSYRGPDGKWVKPPGHSKPDLQAHIDYQITCKKPKGA